MFDDSAWNRQRDPVPSRELRGARCIPAADYLIAGRGAGVLHYDRHFDPLCRVLGIESVWVAEPGSID